MDNVMHFLPEVSDDSFPERQILFNEDVVTSVLWRILDGFPNVLPQLVGLWYLQKSLLFLQKRGRSPNSHSHPIPSGNLT